MASQPTPKQEQNYDRFINKVLPLLSEYFITGANQLAFKPPWNMAACAFDKTHKEDKDLSAAIKAHISRREEPVQVHWVTKKNSDWTREADWWRIGVYQLFDNKIIWACIDFDGGTHSTPLADPLQAALRVQQVLTDVGVTSYLERSGSGSGYHIWIFFNRTGVEPSKVRSFLLNLIPTDIPLLKGGMANHRSSLGIEVFPKHNKSRQDGPGYMVWLPFWHGAKDGGNHFYKIDEESDLVRYLPDSFERVSDEQVEQLYKSFGLNSKSTEDLSTSDKHFPTQAEVLAALERLSYTRLTTYQLWLHVGMALHNFDAGDWGIDTWDKWSQKSPEKYQPDVCRKKWESFHKQQDDNDLPANQFSITAIFRWANEDDPDGYYLPGWGDDAAIQVTVPLRVGWLVRKRGNQAKGRITAIKAVPKSTDPRRITVVRWAPTSCALAADFA